VRYFRVGVVGQRQGRRAAAPAPNTFSQEWANYIAARIRLSEDHTLKISMQTVGRVLAEECNKLKAEFKAELERELVALRNDPTRRGARQAAQGGVTVRRHDRVRA
jgi:hypothetical protein